jgi:hypothetical protein
MFYDDEKVRIGQLSNLRQEFDNIVNLNFDASYHIACLKSN